MEFKGMYDISWPVASSMTTYKDRADVFVSGDRIALHPHTGTHIDAPAHFAGGEPSEALDLHVTCGACRVIDCTDVVDAITADVLAAHNVAAGERILCKTRNSRLAWDADFAYDFVFCDASAASYCAEQRITAIGIDYLGIERDQPDHPTHRILLSRGILIIEGLRLHDVPAGVYTLICVPLYVHGCDGAPARALLYPQS